MAERANRVLIVLAIFFLLVTVSIVAANVVSRYLLHVSLTWSAELARYSMIWSALLAAAVLVSRQEHLRVDLFGKALRNRARVLLAVLNSIGCMSFFLIMLISGSILVFRTSGQMASSMEWLPMNLVYLIVPVSALLMLLGSCAALLKTLAGDDAGDETRPRVN